MRELKNELQLAKRWEVKVVGSERSIQLFDNENNKLAGHEAYWEGYFECDNQELTSLEGSPCVVYGDFDCSDNKLGNLLGGPRNIDGSFFCLNNDILSIEGSPERVNGYFDCSDNKNLKSLEYSPNVVGDDFFCYGCNVVDLSGFKTSITDGGLFLSPKPSPFGERSVNA